MQKKGVSIRIVKHNGKAATAGLTVKSSVEAGLLRTVSNNASAKKGLGVVDNAVTGLVSIFQTSAASFHWAVST
jgi:hypothetical protein